MDLHFSHLRFLLDSITDYAVFTLDIDGNITSWNQGAQNAKGYSEKEILGRNFSCFYENKDQASGLPSRALEIAKTIGKYQEQGWRIKKNGEKFWADVTIHPLRDQVGGVHGFVKVTKDATRNLELEKLKEEYYRSQKHEIIGQMTGGVAHDFNNLLTIIASGHELIRMYSQDERIDRILEVNQVGIERSKKLISQMMAFSGKQIIKPEPTNINEIISIFDVLINKAIGENFELIWHLNPDLSSVLLDRAQCQSALLNLIFNARDAMPHGGVLRIFSEMVDLPLENINIFDEPKPGRYVVIGVSDTGKGIPSDIIKRTVEPFFTTKEFGRGPGLGLSQCYGFARQSGGTISVDSVENVGTTVRMFFPPSPTAAGSEKKIVSRTILLVDDEPAIRDLVGEMLRTLGHTVYTAEDAQDALSQLKHNISIDYLFTDIIMPHGMTGVELVEKAHLLRPDLPSLLASGYSRDVLRNLADLRDDINFLQKPYSLEEIAKYVNIENKKGSSH